MIYLPSRLPFIFKPALLPFPGGLYRHLKKNKDKYDLVISSETFSIASLIATIALPGKVMIWQELPTHQRLLFKLPSKIWHNLAGRVIMRNTPVVGRSLPARNFIRQYLKHVSDKIVDHGANSEIFSPNPENTHQKRFIVISQLIKRKRIDYIISQFAKFAAMPEYSDYTLDIVGKGPQKEELQKLILSLGMTEKINLRGFLTHKELTPLSASSTGLLVYTDQDLNMVTIPESIVNGTPVLTNTVPCTASFIDSNHLGIVKDNWVRTNWHKWPKITLRCTSTALTYGICSPKKAAPHAWLKYGQQNLPNNRHANTSPPQYAKLILTYKYNISAHIPW